MSRRGALKRNGGARQPLKRVHMVFEGSVSEPDYIDNFIRSLDNRFSTPGEIIRGAGVPKTIVETCVNLKTKVERDARRAGYAGLEEVWAIFDVDAHDLDQALPLAKQHLIRCVISNPCFEVWGFLHQGRYNRPDHRHDVQRGLRDVIPDYHHERNPKFNWEWCYPRIGDAMNNAENGRKAREEEGSIFPRDVPSTNFDRLLKVFALNSAEFDSTVKTWPEW